MINNAAKINYNLIENTSVKIAIYNVDGVLVRNLYEGTQEAGEHSHILNMNSIPSGIYVLKASIGTILRTIIL
jgi:flagellar hook assembly protein FlgD